MVFAGDWGDYTITRDGSTYTVAGFGFTDTVTDVETFVFGGLSVDVTEDPDVIVTAIGPEVVSVEEAGIDEDEDADTVEVDEGSQTGTVVATVTADDTNLPAGDTLTFTLVDADGDAYTGPFTITKTGDGTAEITVDGTLDFLTQSNHVLIVKITDSDGQSTTQDVTVTVLDVNDAPSDIEFGDDAPSVDENVAGAVITTVLGFDQNAGDVLSYTVDDIRFTITEQDGTYVLRLKEGEKLDHETADTVTVSITATDLEGATRSEDLTITVNDVNEVPTNILFDEDAPQIDENEMGAVITTLTASDPDDGDTLSFSVSDERFEVVEEDGTYTLKLKDDESLNFEAENGAVTLTVSVMDSQGETRDEDITIPLNDLNEGPTDIVLDEGTPSVSENADGAVITTLIVADQDANDSFTFSVDDDRFEIVEEDGTFSLKLKAGVTLDYEVETAVDLEITVEDADGESFTKTLTVTVLDVNEAPGNGAALAVWTPDAVQSGLRRAELFPEAGVTDPEGDDLTYTLVTGPTAGTLYLGDVAVVAGQELTAAEFATLTYGAPAAGSYGAAFTVSDGENVTPLNIVLTVSAAVDDTLVAASKGGTLDGGAGDDTIRGSSSDDTLYGGAGADSIRGGDSGDSLFGADGADILRGNKGDDTLFGESGKDFVAGGLGDDLIYGGLGNDKLHGRDGADTLNGGTGRDILRGGDGADDFVFSTALGRSNVDTIVDFASGVDEIVLDGAIFGALGGSIAAREFQIGAQADDRTDHLIYNKATGELFYDVDGSGRRDQILFAEFEAGTDLRFDDFAMLR